MLKHHHIFTWCFFSIAQKNSPFLQQIAAEKWTFLVQIYQVTVSIFDRKVCQNQQLIVSNSIRFQTMNSPFFWSS